MENSEETKARKRYVRDMTFLSIMLGMMVISSIGYLLHNSYPQVGYVSMWVLLASMALFTIYFIYVNEIAFKRANPIGWIMIILGMVTTAQLLVALVF